MTAYPGNGIARTPLPKGFLASGINCGIRRYRPDLGLIISQTPSVAVGVFTQNTCKAAPVRYCQQLLPATDIQAIITNSGQANAATGEKGLQNNLAMAKATAESLGIKPTQVLTASTGVIGEHMVIDKITAAIPKLKTSASVIAEKFATAILTTDLVPKTVYKEVTLSSGTITLTGICKGSGMIHPNMATMLGYLLSDVKLTPEQAQHLLTKANADSFNMISVDGEPSTNDSVFLLANGESGVAPVGTDDMQVLQQALNEISILLAKSIARDGEGATKLLEITIKRAPDLKLAKQLARSLTISPLLKTAIHGEQPNWGRVIARLGAERIASELLDQCTIYFQGFTVYAQGAPAEQHNPQLAESMHQDSINISIDLTAGSHQATAWGCDLSEKYITINGSYLS